jgi:hypothetical protein
MKTSELKQLIKEEIKKSLKEVGEATLEPYPWKKSIVEDGITVYNFKTDLGSIYRVSLDRFMYDNFPKINEEIPAIEVVFAVIDESGKYYSTSKITNKGEIYRVMSTIVDIIKSFILKNPEINVIMYEPMKKEGEINSKRGELYKTFIKKQIPTATFKDSYSDIIVRLP